MYTKSNNLNGFCGTFFIEGGGGYNPFAQSPLDEDFEDEAKSVPTFAPLLISMTS